MKICSGESSNSIIKALFSLGCHKKPAKFDYLFQRGRWDHDKVLTSKISEVGISKEAEG